MLALKHLFDNKKSCLRRSSSETPSQFLDGAKMRKGIRVLVSMWKASWRRFVV
jgi:hypothetical protein